MYNTPSFIFQTVISGLYMFLEYLEIINIYNCEKYRCGGVSCSVLAVLAFNAMIFRENIDLSIPVVIAHALGGTGLLFWGVEYWKVSTPVRTEYYDTHSIFFSMMFIVNQFAIYRYLDKNHERFYREQVIRQVMSTKDSEDARLKAARRHGEQAHQEEASPAYIREPRGNTWAASTTAGPLSK